MDTLIQQTPSTPQGSRTGWYIPCPWQDGLCVWTTYNALWITTTSQSTYSCPTQEVWVFPTLLPYQLLHALICPTYLSQTSTSYHFQNSNAHAGKTKNISLADLKSKLKWETFVHTAQGHLSELTGVIHCCHPPPSWVWYAFWKAPLSHFTTSHSVFHSTTQPKDKPGATVRDTDQISISSVGKLLLLLCLSEKQTVHFPQCQQQPSRAQLCTDSSTAFASFTTRRNSTSLLTPQNTGINTQGWPLRKQLFECHVLCQNRYRKASGVTASRLNCGKNILQLLWRYANTFWRCCSCRIWFHLATLMCRRHTFEMVAEVGDITTRDGKRRDWKFYFK